MKWLIKLLGGYTEEEYNSKEVHHEVDCKPNTDLLHKVESLEKELDSAKTSLKKLEEFLETKNQGKMTVLEPTKKLSLNMIEHVSYNDDGKQLYNEVSYTVDIKNTNHSVNYVWPGEYDMYINGKKHSFGQHKKAFEHINKLLSEKDTLYISIELVPRSIKK